MSVVFKRGKAELEANLTPLIDVTFLLIVFFVLVSQIVEVESVPMQLPEPTDPVTERPADEQRAVINVIPGAGGGVAGYRIGSRAFAADPAGTAALTALLTELFTVSPRISVNLRTDRATHYTHVEPILAAVSEAARRVPDAEVAPRVNLVVLRED